MRSRTVASVVAGLFGSGCLFDGAATAGLPCEKDEHCGGGLACVDGVCGGAAADSSSGGTEESSDASADSEAECAASDRACDGPEALRVCDDGELVTRDCSAECAPRPSFGCASATQGDACICDGEAPGACVTDGAIDCVGAGGVRVCDAGQWVPFDCDAVCETAPRGAFVQCAFDSSRGHDVCFCDEGAPCPSGAVYCLDANTLGACEGGTWSSFSCTQLCAEQGLGVAVACVFRASLGTDACICSG